jgi:hypothetical protein
VALIVPLEDPDINATLRFKLELAPEDTCPVTVKVVPVGAIAGKHDDEGLLTAVTVPVKLLPLWLKFTVNVVLGGAVPCDAVGANATFQLPMIAGV